MCDERLNSNTASNYTISIELSFYGTKTIVEFIGSCLKQDKVIYSHGKIVNIYTVYEISKNYNTSTYPTLEYCLTENADIDQYKYSGYGIGFDKKREFSFGSRGFDRNCIIFWADMNSSSHTNNNKIIISLPLIKNLFKEKMVQQLMQKNCFQLILLKIMKGFL